MLKNIVKLVNKNKLVFPSYAFLNNFFFIFENNSAIYNEDSLKQNFDLAVRALIKECSIAELKLMVPVERLKLLIQKYNFSSFGNNCFTKLMFLLGRIERDYERLILEEVMSRYPFLFYYSMEEGEPYVTREEEGIKSVEDLYFEDSFRNEKGELMEMLEKDPECNKENFYYRYLASLGKTNKTWFCK